MKEIDDGGAAFPVLERSGVDRDEVTHYHVEGGMSLREYFAAHAPPKPETFRPLIYARTEESEIDCLIRWQWHYADAMIRARTNPRGETK